MGGGSSEVQTGAEEATFRLRKDSASTYLFIYLLLINLFNIYFNPIILITLSMLHFIHNNL